jgi:hypothetical protein
MSAGTVEAVMIEKIEKTNDYLQVAMFCFGVVKKNRGRGKQEVGGWLGRWMLIEAVVSQTAAPLG